MPPWALRPPSCWPEEWVAATRALKMAMRVKWKVDQPHGFGEQEVRRALWLDAKKAGKVAKAATVVVGIPSVWDLIAPLDNSTPFPSRVKK